MVIAVARAAAQPAAAVTFFAAVTLCVALFLLFAFKTTVTLAAAVLALALATAGEAGAVASAPDPSYLPFGFTLSCPPIHRRDAAAQPATAITPLPPPPSVTAAALSCAAR